MSRVLGAVASAVLITLGAVLLLRITTWRSRLPLFPLAGPEWLILLILMVVLACYYLVSDKKW